MNAVRAGWSRNSIRLVLACSLAWSVSFAACGSAKPQVKKDPREERLETADDLLDARVKRKGTPQKASAGPSMADLPEPEDEPAKSIDAKNDDWKDSRYRRFDQKRFVESGAQFWSGSSDAAFRAAVDGDDSYLYFIVEVKDDTVLNSEAGSPPTDGIVLWLRDPGLDLLVQALPASLGLSRYVEAETAILFEPDGTIRPYGDHDLPLESDYLFATMDRRKNGYVLEIALKVEIFRQVSALPLPEIAFRIELLDGDEKDRPGHQTVLSTLPDTGADSPRMAIFEIGGLLPHRELTNTPPRSHAIGQWELQKGKWAFTSFEVVPRYWMTLGDSASFEKALRESDALADVCHTARKDIDLVEAYQSRRGGFRTGLVLCGDRAIEGRCPSSAKSNLYWVALKNDGEEWFLDQAVRVFEEPLTQCTHQKRPGEPFYGDFSLFPMDVVEPSLWAIGWSRSEEEKGTYERKNAVTLVSSERRDGPVGTIVTELKRADTQERVLSTNQVYFTYVDDDDALDICAREKLIEQGCAGLDRDCRTYERGKTILTNIQMWNVEKEGFERYELSKHRYCSANFNFAEREGFLLLQLKGRIGLLPSPQSNEQEEESLDIF